jgi:hypothetical protein
MISFGAAGDNEKRSRGDVTGLGFADGAAEPEQEFAR